ncbi:MAG: hypothetical protein ACREV6_20395 [Clostridium sp.]|uniref:hypothetical protein n=1 Tax=Clostridium sp. TaxID=1506 RepID=UPI003D6D347B
MNTTYCGWVNSLIQADTTAIFNQYQAWFTAQSNNYNIEMIANQATFQSNFKTRFATIQGQLNGDIAGNLTNLINKNTKNIASLGESLASHSTDNSKHVNRMLDVGTSKHYQLGILNGLLYYKEVL